MESHLHKHLIEHLNAEIFLGTIHDITIVIDWIRTTFLYVRACESPQNYGMAKTLNINEIENKLYSQYTLNLYFIHISNISCAINNV